MTFTAFLVVALVQLTPFGPAQNNIALPFLTMKACEAYLKMTKEEIKHASSFSVIKGSTTCVPASDIKTEDNENSLKDKVL